MTFTPYTTTQAPPEDPCFEKLLSDNRELSFQQSKNTRNGQVAEFNAAVREEGE